MPAKSELIAHGHTTEEICELIGSDGLIYQDLDDLIASAREGNPEIEQFDCSVFNGEYVQPIAELKKTIKSKFEQGNQLLNRAIEYVVNA